MLGLLWWRFRRAGLAMRPLIGLGFAWLVCLPLSVNALRKAGLVFDIALDARRAMRMISPEGKSRARAELAAQISEEMQELEEGDALYRRLAELKQQLTPEAAHERL